MPDPVTDKVAEVADKATGGNFFSTLLNAPIDFAKGLISAPLSALLGLGKGVFNGTLGNIGGVVAGTGIGMLILNFAPSLVEKLNIKVNGKNAGQKLADDARDGGFVNNLKNAGLVSLAVNGAIGGISGAVGGATSGGGENKSGASKVGQVLGGLGTVGLIGVLAFTAVNSNKVGFAGTADNTTPKTPDPTPGNPAPETNKTKV